MDLFTVNDKDMTATRHRHDNDDNDNRQTLKESEPVVTCLRRVCHGSVNRRPYTAQSVAVFSLLKADRVSLLMNID
jgi:hypothetical protein